MKLAIIGSRTFLDYKKLTEEILNSPYYSPYYEFGGSYHDPCFNLDEIVSGGAVGADSLAAQFAKQYDIKLVEFFPDWEKHGKKAGFVRNKEIIEYADEVLAFWDGVSKGSANSLSIAKKLKKKTTIVYF